MSPTCSTGQLFLRFHAYTVFLPLSFWLTLTPSTIATLANAVSMALAPPKVPPLLLSARCHLSCWCSPASGMKFCTPSIKCADVCSKSCRCCWCRHSSLQKILAQILCEMVLLYYTNLHVILLISDMCPGTGSEDN